MNVVQVEGWAPDDPEAELARTWVWFAESAPILVGGYPMSCPRCASSEGIRLWLHQGRTPIEAEHDCGGRDRREGTDRCRRWQEPRVTVGEMHQHGETMLDRYNRYMRPVVEDMAARRRAHGPGPTVA